MSQITLPNGQVVFHDWYASPEGLEVMSATNGGMLMFTWAAVLKDGSIIHQFDIVNSTRALNDENFVPSENNRLSVERLQNEDVVQFSLFPIAFVRKRCPWFQQPISMRLRPGERLISFWETDWTPRTDYKLRRTVIGFKREVKGEEIISLVVISPSGQIAICSDMNHSFEGE